MAAPTIATRLTSESLRTSGVPPDGRSHSPEDAIQAARANDRALDPLPLAYGYLRVDLLDSVALILGEQRLVTAAFQLGCQLAAVFLEPAPHSTTVPPAFLDLVQECRRSEAHTVITVCGHMSGMAVPHTCLLDILARRAAAQVCEVAL
ncbi:hypothetical protein [Nocardia sp. NBC_01327]|uniref:hypothetical protein n=1 Tax=Nocardia sp. NBC_01327 TaxID=2903593 RepID=UPI002E0F9828|nr:hypothetical protein OG326_21555 [Nocardia sp. NBC_01327]